MRVPDFTEDFVIYNSDDDSDKNTLTKIVVSLIAYRGYFRPLYYFKECLT